LVVGGTAGGADAFLTSGVGQVPQSFLREYIAYAKRASCPGLSEQAGEALVQVRDKDIYIWRIRRYNYDNM
jgi:DNA replicative helicase MCM subunit Mcm2 (Cdc46/Mcm family)